jgi:hypothetical protein
MAPIWRGSLIAERLFALDWQDEAVFEARAGGVHPPTPYPPHHPPPHPPTPLPLVTPSIGTPKTEYRYLVWFFTKSEALLPQIIINRGVQGAGGGGGGRNPAAR